MVGDPAARFEEPEEGVALLGGEGRAVEIAHGAEELRAVDACRRNKVQIGIITVPAEDAQHVCDLLIECGIRAIWNFAPKHLDVPPDILVHNENMAASLALLSKHLSYKIKNEE